MEECDCDLFVLLPLLDLPDFKFVPCRESLEFSVNHNHQTLPKRQQECLNITCYLWLPGRGAGLDHAGTAAGQHCRGGTFPRLFRFGEFQFLSSLCFLAPETRPCVMMRLCVVLFQYSLCAFHTVPDQPGVFGFFIADWRIVAHLRAELGKAKLGSIFFVNETWW